MNHLQYISVDITHKCRPNDDEGNKVLPSNFEKYRKEHEFRYPCCLCAEEGGRGAYTEAAVYSWRDKTTDQICWNARCASDQCGYRGQCSLFLRRSKTNYHLVKIDAYYQRSSVVACQYPRRGMNLLRCRFVNLMK